MVSGRTEVITGPFGLAGEGRRHAYHAGRGVPVVDPGAPDLLSGFCVRVIVVKYVLFYDLADGAEALAQEHFAAHSERLMAFHERGLLLMVGTFTDLPMGAMSVFTSREAVEEFMADDPFVRHAVVAAPRVREWDEILGEP